jgi:mannosyltransferase
MRRRRLRRGPHSSNLLTIALPALLAGLVCAIGLGGRSLWLDEGASFAIASQHGAALWQAIARDGGNMSAYYLLLHGVIDVFGTSLTALRAPSVLADAATAAITAALGLRLFVRRAGLAAGVLVATGLPLVFWGQDARGYALMVSAASASFLALVWVLDAPDGAGPPRGALVLYGLSLLLAMYLSFDAVLVVPAQLVVVMAARRKAALPLFATLGLVAVACVPLLVLATERGSSQLFWVPSPSLSVLGQAAVTLTAAGMPPNFHHTSTTGVLLGLTGLGLLGTLLAGGVSRRGHPDAPGWRWLLIATWFLVPAALATVAALAGEPIELARSSILLAPAVALLLAWGLVQPRLPRTAALGGFAVLLGLRALQLGPSYGTSPENWKAAAQYVGGSQPAPSCVAFYPQDGRMAFDYYVRSSAERKAAPRLRPVLPRVPWSVVRPFVERYTVPDRRSLAAIVRSCPRLWLIASHEGQRHGPSVSRRDYARYHRLLRGLERRYPHHLERSFGYAAQVRVVLLRR